MGLWYSITADIIATLLFFYLPAIYFLSPRKGNRYMILFLFVVCYLIWEIPTRFFMEIENTVSLIAKNYLFLLILIFLIYRGSWKRKLACWIFIIFLGVLTDIITSALLLTVNPNYINQYMKAEFSESFTNTAHLMSLLVCEVLNTMIALFYLTWFRAKRMKQFLGFFLLPVYQIFIMLGFFMLCGNFDEKVGKIGLAMGILNLLLDGSVLYLLEGLFRKLEREKELQILENKRKEEYEYYKSSAEAMEQFRLIRHDFANQLQTAYGMMNEPENAEKVKKLLEQMKKTMESEKSD